MKIIGKNLRRNVSLGRYTISFDTEDKKACEDFFTSTNADEFVIEIKRKTKKRSLDANSYFWKLADELAKKLNTTSVEVYKEIVKRVGVYHELLVDTDDIGSLCRDWAKNGIGWFALKGHSVGDKTVIRLYSGSSCYDSKQMSRLIDELCYECEENGVPTLLDASERREIIDKW